MSAVDPNASVPLSVLQALLPLAAAAGIDLPNVTRIAPTLNVATEPRALALDLGRLAAKEDLFLFGSDLVTVDEETGETRPLRPARFVTWMAEFVEFINTERGPRGLSREVATLVLESDVFRGCLRRLDAVHLVRLPVRRADGAMFLLEPGYDEPSRIFTVETVKFDTGWELPTATEFFAKQLAQYPWSEGNDVMTSRSAAVQVAAIIGTFCRAMFAPGTTRPMIAYLANQPGTGKSTLAAMALIPVFGSAPTNKTPKDDEVMDKELETVAQTLQPFIFFDDIGKGMFSNPLNRFITSTAHSGRIMGGNREMFRSRAVTQVFATGNGLKISTDLMRRALIVELFLASDVRGRRYDHVITQAWLERDEVRQDFLAAAYCMARTWHETYEAGVHPSPIESFEDWTSIVGAIVMAGGFADPLTPPELLAGGDEEGDELRELLIKLAGQEEMDCVFNRKDLVDSAREWGLIESLVGSKDDKDLDSAANKRLGRQLERWRGRELVDERRRAFRFGHRRKRREQCIRCNSCPRRKPSGRSPPRSIRFVCHSTARQRRCTRHLSRHRARPLHHCRHAVPAGRGLLAFVLSTHSSPHHLNQSISPSPNYFTIKRE